MDLLEDSITKLEAPGLVVLRKVDFGLAKFMLYDCHWLV